MNDYMKTEILNLKLMVNTYMQRLQYAALRDDETISADEAKIIRRAEKASNRFLKDLEKLSRA